MPFATNYNLYVTNPIWGTVLTISGNLSSIANADKILPCNAHDLCYQTCGNQKMTCDDALVSGIDSSCDTGYPFPCNRPDQTECVEYEEEYNSCKGISSTFRDGVNSGSGMTAYKDRQTQYCACCKTE